MNKPLIFFKKTTVIAACAVLAAGCGVMPDSAELRKQAQKVTLAASKAPAEAPFRTVTNFTSAVRCMDSMFITFGIRDVSILMEDLDDATKKVSVGTKDMMLTTTSDMTRRSRAIRFIAFGSDSKNAMGFMERAEQKGAYSSMPQFGLRGSISQMDDNVAKASKDVGIGIGDFMFGKSASATSKIVAIDMTIMNLADFSIVPGVSSRNSVAIFSEGHGTDAEARYKKFGINYATSLSKSEGTAVAVRNLLELAAVELLGKLTKVPYWKCLGLNEADADGEVKAEVEDWFESMASNPVELIAWWQYQMYTRGTYTGQVNGAPSPAFAQSLRDYKAAMGLKADTDLNAEFMLTYLQADHTAAMARYEAMKPKLTVATGPILASVRLKGGDRKLKSGEKLEFEVVSNNDAYASCFLLDDNKKVLRIHPNRYSRNTFVGAGKSLAIPDSPKFSLVATAKGVDEIVECYVASKDVLNTLPPDYSKTDLIPLTGINTLEQLKSQFERSSPIPVTTARYVISGDRRN